ncbi:MAG: hypothetical protein VKP72_10485 [bacterium]|nr:hypothetical protein [bacterium]
MTNRLFAQGLALASVATLVAIAGCDMANLPGSTKPSSAPSSSPSSAPSATPAPLNTIYGKANFGGGDTGAEVSLFLKFFNGTSFVKQNQTTLSDTKGNYSFADLTLASGKYQVCYDDGGQEVTASDVNTVGVLVGESFQYTAGTPASKSFDLKWEFSPTVAPNATFTKGGTFSWANNSYFPGAEYQLAVADASKSIKFSSAWATSTSRTWNGKAGSETDSPAGSVMAGQAYYQIKFRKAGTAYGGEGYYGQTKWVPITIN